MNSIIKLENITKIYRKQREQITALQQVSLVITKGRFHVIKGHSGSGKSTLLNIMGLLDQPTEGDVYIEGKKVSQLSIQTKALLRMKYIGFAFQEFYLNETLRAYENVMVPMFINPHIPSDQMEETACTLLEKVGLQNRIKHYPKELSGGEKQRVSIARALANDPVCILADEPTGSLDAENEKIVLEILKDLSLQGKSIVVVSHGQEALQYADQIFSIKASRIEDVSNEIEK